MTKIFLLGDYSGNNIGHNALLLSIIHEFKFARQCRFFVPTLKPGLLRKVFSKDERIVFVSISPWNLSLKFLGLPIIKLIKEVDCILLTDNPFYDTGFLNPFKNNLIALLFVTAYARYLSKPLVCYNAGVGPVKSPWGRFCVRWISARMNLIMLRDYHSKGILDEISPKNESIITADSGFNMPVEEVKSQTNNEFLKKHISLWERGWIGVNISYHILDRFKGKRQSGLSNDQIIKYIAQALEFAAVKKDVGLVFFITHPKDRNVSLEIIKKIQKVDHIIMVDQDHYSVYQMALLASRSMCTLGTRYHELVMFASTKVPIIGLNCGDKISSLFSLLNMPGLLLDLDDLVYENDFDKLHSLIDLACKTREDLSIQVEKMKEMAAKGFSLLLEQGYICPTQNA